jgi:hypothetical protein
MPDDIVNPIGEGGEKPVNPIGEQKLTEADSYVVGDMASVYGGDEGLKRYFKGEECQVYQMPDLTGTAVVVLFPYVADPKDQYRVHIKQLRRRVLLGSLNVWIHRDDVNKIRTGQASLQAVSASLKDMGEGWVCFNQDVASKVFKEIIYMNHDGGDGGDVVNPVGP